MKGSGFVWEIIRLNEKKTYKLLFNLGLNYFLFGFIIVTILSGLFSVPFTIFNISYGIVGGLLTLASLLFLVHSTYHYGKEIIISQCRAEELSPSMHPLIFNILEEMLVASNCGFRPKLYATPGMAPNAFAVGIKSEKSAIIVTTGLLVLLNRSQLQGVIAHELAHIINKDTLYLTFAATIFNRKPKTKLFNFSGNYQYTSIFSKYNKFIYISLSINREYLADATAIRFTRYPEGLASALELISSSNIRLHEVRRKMIPFYIVDPLKENRTHPDTLRRVRILRNITKGANYNYYQESYSKVLGTNVKIIPENELEEEYIPLKSDKAMETSSNTKTEQDLIREIKDLDKAINHYRFIGCNCGLKLKIPPECKKDMIRCPRCGYKHQLIDATFEKPDSPYKISPFKDEIRDINLLTEDCLYIRKKLDYWESFYCDCGHMLQLSPGFTNLNIRCTRCNKKIKIKDKGSSEKDTKKTRLKEAFCIMTHQREDDNWDYFSCKCGNVIELAEGFKKPDIRCRKCGGRIKIVYPEKLGGDK